jgi:hypothetical protein
MTILNSREADMKSVFGDGFPSCAAITDEDTPLTVYLKSLQAERVLDARTNAFVDLETLCQQGQREFTQRKKEAEPDRNKYIRKPI